MAKKTRKKVAPKAKKKTWFSVVAPKLFMNQEIAEVPTFEQESLVGKSLKMNMMTLTKDPKAQGIAVSFRITSLKGDKGITEVSGYQIQPSSVKRMVRRGKDRLDQNVKVRTKDGCIVMLKPMVLTRAITKSSVHKGLYAETISFLQQFAGKYNYETLVNAIVYNKLQRQLFDRLKKVYPVAIVKIRVMKLLSDEIPESTGDVAHLGGKKPFKKRVPKKVEEKVEEKAEEAPAEEAKEEATEEPAKEEKTEEAPAEEAKEEVTEEPAKEEAEDSDKKEE